MFMWPRADHHRFPLYMLIGGLQNLPDASHNGRALRACFTFNAVNPTIHLGSVVLDFSRNKLKMQAYFILLQLIAKKLSKSN